VAAKADSITPVKIEKTEYCEISDSSLCCGVDKGGKVDEPLFFSIIERNLDLVAAISFNLKMSFLLSNQVRAGNGLEHDDASEELLAREFGRRDDGQGMVNSISHLSPKM
jgi:hypothetical protein